VPQPQRLSGGARFRRRAHGPVPVQGRRAARPLPTPPGSSYGRRTAAL
jgi:hypothetical protein